MRRLSALLLFATVLVAQQPARISGLAWLTGHWSGPLGQGTTEEHWTSPAAGIMLAVSRTMAGERLRAFEFLRIEERADGVYYVAQPQGRPPTDFKLTKSGPTSAVFENPMHDHPKVIAYERKGSDLDITLEGDERGQHVKQAFHMNLQ